MIANEILTRSSTGFKQLSEKEMMQKALMNSIQEIKTTRRSRNNTDDEYDSP